MDSHSYTYVYDEERKEMDSHSYRNVHTENQIKKKWIVICTEMCMKKTTCTKMDSRSYRNEYDEKPIQKEMDSLS